MTAKNLKVERSVKAFFREMVAAALVRQRLKIEEQTSFYLVNLLADFSRTEMLFNSTEEKGETEPLALMLYRALEMTPDERIKLFKQMGDFSLYISGFFADSFNRSLVDVDYYIAMGGGAYDNVAALVRERPEGEIFSDLFAELAIKFAPLVEVLNEISDQSHINTNRGLLRLYERWLKTRSDRLSELLREQGVIPNSNLPDGSIQ